MLHEIVRHTRVFSEIRANFIDKGNLFHCAISEMLYLYNLTKNIYLRKMLDKKFSIW